MMNRRNVLKAAVGAFLGMLIPWKKAQSLSPEFMAKRRVLRLRSVDIREVKTRWKVTHYVLGKQPGEPLILLDEYTILLPTQYDKKGQLLWPHSIPTFCNHIKTRKSQGKIVGPIYAVEVEVLSYIRTGTGRVV